VSIVEPNAAGKVIPIGFDSGIDVSAANASPLVTSAGSTGYHRILFWPKTKSPLLLLTNLRDDVPAAIGRIRVIRRNQLTPSVSTSVGTRQVIAHFDRPFFTENFCAAEAIDSSPSGALETGRSLEDWNTFYDGAVRMVQYLRYVGYDSVALSCWSDGSTLYPSRLLLPTPKHDRGVFYSDGRDPLRKDVLEMLFRICDREGIQLIPVVEFSTPLPMLEQQLHSHQAATGIRLVDQDGETWEQKFGNRRGRLPYYNVLDDRVQSAMLAVIRELVTRYDTHASFGGVQINMTGSGYSQLPNADWGMDATTIRQFLQDASLPVTDFPPNAYATVVKLLDEPLRATWIDWRCQQVTEFYQRLAQEVSGQNQTARLYLSMVGLIDSIPVQRSFSPSLATSEPVRQPLQNMGIDLQQMGAQPHTVIARPYRHSVSFTWNEQGADLEVNASDRFDSQFQNANQATVEFRHQPYQLRLTSFDEVSPFGRANTFMLLVSHATPTGVHNRQRFAHGLAKQDVLTVLEGGWMLPMGQEDSLLPFVDVFRRLPAKAFQTFEDETERAKPVVIRSLNTDDQTFVYAVNDSPWQVSTQVVIRAARGSRILSLGKRTTETLEFASSATDGTWTITLDPYDLVAIRISDPQAQIMDAATAIPEQVMPELQQRIQALAARAAYMRNPDPYLSLANSSFEAPSEDHAVPGWAVEPGEGRRIRIDRRLASEGDASLLMESDQQPALIWSEPFALPDSGKLAITLKARSDMANLTNRLQVVLEIDGKAYFPWAAVGDAKSAKPLTDQWSEFVFRMAKLPVEGGKSIRVGLHLPGTGRVWFDDVRVFDMLVLDEAEQRILSLKNSVADYDRRHRRVGDCWQAINGYWPRYLMENVPQAKLDQNVTKRRDVKSAKPVRTPEKDDSPERTSRLDRLRDILPRLPSWR
ncbi:MAG: family 10 glycosylhydrolase, partial [Planctomycetales bacterium]|nr:family 10 glycosylhydrolase [Planctomycetales bacterium]